MTKRDLKREFADFYRPSAKEVTQVDIPAMSFLMVDGMGDPNTSASYSAAVEALFSLSYAIKFATKRGSLAIDYGVMPLEGLWWADDLSAFEAGDRAAWRWTMMIMQPDFVSSEVVADVTHEVARKKAPESLDLVRFETFHEGLSAQTLHLGPFAEEAPTIERVHDFIEASGHRKSGKHHEIYLSDIRRADPTKWKTIIRQPMR